MKQFTRFFSLCALVFITSCSNNKQLPLEILQSTINTYTDSLHKPWAGAVFSEGKIYTYQTSLKDSLGNTLFTDSMRYEIGSTSKLLVGLAIMQLYEQGKIRFEDPISTYFSKEIVDNISKDSAGKSYGDQIKIYHLLNHTSGIFSYASHENAAGKSNNPFEALSLVLRSIEAKSTEDNIGENILRQLVFTHPHYFKPGEGWFYSNTNYNLLSMIIKKITGADYKVYVQKNILDVAGMQHTTFGSINPDLKGNYPADDNGKEIIPIDYKSVMGSGEMISTPKDMCLLAQALFEYKIIKKETFDFMLKNQYITDKVIPSTKQFGSLDKTPTYGIANFAYDYKGNIYYGHGGHTYGFSTSLALDIEHKTASFVANNRPQDAAPLPLSFEILYRLQYK